MINKKPVKARRAIPSTATTIDVEALLKEADSAAADDVKAAIAEALEQERKAKRDELVGQLKVARAQTLRSVNRLREVREQEKTAKKEVELYAIAEKQFHTDADFTRYTNNCHSIAYNQKLVD